MYQPFLVHSHTDPYIRLVFPPQLCSPHTATQAHTVAMLGLNYVNHSFGINILHSVDRELCFQNSVLRHCAPKFKTPQSLFQDFIILRCGEMCLRLQVYNSLVAILWNTETVLCVLYFQFPFPTYISINTPIQLIKTQGISFVFLFSINVQSIL